MRLIDVDALPNYKLIGTMALGSERSPAELRIVLWEDIKSMPTIDAVPVVRCRECVYKNTTACPAYDAPFMRTSLRIKFCSEGQRREADHETVQ
jgi:hypothetical protein